MKFSETWLREWTNPAISTDELVAQLTMAGLEVDGVESVAGAFSGVVVAEIVGIEPHPNADKLRVCQVAFGGDAPIQVVCGAPNARLGLRIPFAQVGAVLPGDFKIKKAKLRQVESFGMLCGASELGMEDLIDGLMELPGDAPVGTDVRDYLSLDDQVVEVDLTPNRGDCLSIAGIAREVGVLNRCDVKSTDVAPVTATIDDTFPVAIDAGQACPRYVGRVIRNIQAGVETPLWMQEKLRRSGVRSIDPVVDVTNFVLLELGQPMHAFDLDTLRGGVQVRMADVGEKLTLLDDQEVSLKEGTLVIADQERAIAMAGVMGGAATAVTETTTNLFLESAFFDPIVIAGKARSYGLHTDSSHRFERGVDYAQQARAIERATQLLLDIVGGEAGPLVVAEVADSLPQAPTVNLKAARLQQILGLELAATEVEEILQRLGLAVTSDDSGWQVSVPSYRFDIAIEADLVEEVARVYGYNNLPTRSPTCALTLGTATEKKIGVSRLREPLMARGYREAISYSFVDPDKQKTLLPSVDALPVANPISAEMAVMRTSLWTGLLSALQYNQNRQQDRVRLFETGLRFVPAADGLQQERMIAGVICGKRLPEGWDQGAEDLDFYDLKSDVEALLQQSGAADAFHFAKGEHSALHPGQTAAVMRGEQLVGYFGTLHPSLLKTWDLRGPVLMFEFNLALLLEANVPSFDELSKFPEVRRDLALLVDESLQADTLIAAAREVAGETLMDVLIFDVYRGKGIDPNRKSLAIGLTFQHPSRTLNDEEITNSVDAVVNVLTERFNANLRS